MPNFNTPRRFQIKHAGTRPTSLEAPSPSRTTEQHNAEVSSLLREHDRSRSRFAATPHFSRRPAVAASPRQAAEEITAERRGLNDERDVLLPQQPETRLETRTRRLHRVETIDDSQDVAVDQDERVDTVEREGWEEVDQRLGLTPTLKRRHSNVQDDGDEEILFDAHDEANNEVTRTASQITHDSIETVLQASPTAHRRFVLRSPRNNNRDIPPPPRFHNTSNVSGSTQASAPRRPTFILPPQHQSTNGSAPPPEQAGTTPLPDVFSPHRRGQKYVTGGMADEVRKWIVDVAHTATPSTSSRRDLGGFSSTQVPSSSLLSTQRTIRGGSHGDRERLKRSILVKITAVEGDESARPGGIMLVEGTQVGVQAGDNSTLRLMLISKGGRNSLETRRDNSVGNSELIPGRAIEARAPVWPVDTLGSTWLVVVDWLVVG